MFKNRYLNVVTVAMLVYWRVPISSGGSSQVASDFPRFTGDFCVQTSGSDVAKSRVDRCWVCTKGLVSDLAIKQRDLSGTV